MLTITRKDGESIQIGEDVIIKVVSIRGNRVRLAIWAPPEVHILRSELEKHEPESESDGEEA